MKDRILDAIATFCLKHPRLIVLIGGLCAVLALSAVTRITLDPDILNLVPQNNQYVKDFKRVLSEMGTIDYHIIVVEIPEGQTVGSYEGYINALGEAWGHSTMIEDVTYKVPNPVELIDTILPRALLFLPPSQIDQVGAALTDESIKSNVARNRALLDTPQALAMKQVIQYDPFHLLPVFIERFKSATGQTALDLTTGYYLSRDHKLALILAKPRKSAQNLPFSREIMAQSEVFENVAAAELKRDHPDLPLPKISYTGGYAIAFDDSELIRSDMIANVLCSVIGVLLIFLIGFRRLAAIVYAGIPMLLALLLTYGVAAVVYGKLASAAAGFAALLAGLGIDFIMLFYGRYVDERNRGLDTGEAIRLAIRTTYPGILVAAVTTAATFYAFLATDFQGMTQLGFLTGTGILIFLVCVMFLLPALLVLNEGPTRKRKPPRHFQWDFGTTRMVNFSVKHPNIVVAVWGVVVAALAVLAPGVEFSDRIQDLRSHENRGVQVQERLTKGIGQSFDFMMYTVEGPDLDAVLDRTALATKKLDNLVTHGQIASYQSITTFLPPRSQQLATIKRLEAGAGGEFSPERIDKTFRAALVSNGFRPESYDSYMKLFNRALAPREPISLEKIENRDIRKLIGRYVKKTPNGYMSVIYLYASGGVWGRTLPPELAELGNRNDGTILTGVNVVSEALRGITTADALRSTTLSFLVVLLLILVSFKGSVRLTLLAFIPFGAGTVVMLGGMAALGLKFNFMNVFVGLMLIGVATDYAIYMLQRYMENPDTFSEDAPETAKAVAMAASATFLGYATFALSHYPGLRSIGYASAFGIGISAIASITLLPAILTIRPHETAKVGGNAVKNPADAVESEAQI